MRFLLRKKWNIAFKIGSEDNSSLFEKIIGIRGFKGETAADDSLVPELRIEHDPFLFSDMEEAAKIIAEAVASGDRILVFGDYDADGVTATAIVCHYLKSAGAEVSYLIPERLTEGYGLSDESIVRIVAAKPDVVITVDNGISSVDEIRSLAEKGIKVIVTDHHECKDILPPACAVIDPKRPGSRYPFRELAGAGVALKLIQALPLHTGKTDEWIRYIDICALGTVADMVSLTDENRMIVYHGLKKINSEGNPGITALIRASMLRDTDNITAATLGFAVAPRINAAGRIGDSSRAVELLLEEDISICEKLADVLCADNIKRQEIETAIFDEAKKMIDEVYDPDLSEAIIVFNKSWHPGVLGIVASKLAEYSRRTVFVFAGDGDKDIYKGSVRSGDGLPVLEAIKHAADHVERFGGHTKAAGLTVKAEKMEDFMKAVREFSVEFHQDITPVPEVDIDFEIPASMISTENALSIDDLEPFGEGNRHPVFACMDLNVISIIPLSEGRHSKMIFDDGEGKMTEGVAFGISPSDLPFSEGDKADIVFTMRINDWKGTQSVQAIIKEFRKSGSPEEDHFQESLLEDVFITEPERFSLILKESAGDPMELNIPSGDDYVKVFRLLKDRFADDTVLCDISLLRDIIIAGTGIRASSFKVNRILDVFSETGLIKLQRHNGELVRFQMTDPDRRVSLSGSSVYRILCAVRTETDHEGA